MQKRDAAAFLAGVSQTEGSQASAPTNLHVISGEVGTRSEDGKTTVAIDGLVFSEADDQYVEMDTLGGLEEGDVATIILTGEDGHAMTPLAIGAPGSVDIIRDTAEAADSKSDAAQELAQAAKDVADAVGQHFWTDENGIHVTEVTQDEWNDVEKLCREWARKYGAVDIVCGPLYQKDVEPRYIGKNKVRVPDAFFKVVLCRQGTPKSIAFVFRNQGKKMAVEEAVCSVDDVERMTGIDFFYNLDDGTENEVEARAELADW